MECKLVDMTNIRAGVKASIRAACSWAAVLCTCLSLQAQDVSYTNFDTEKGLPSQEVYSVYQADDGNIWLATDRGIVCYNSYTFRTYTTADGLSSNTNFIITSDTTGALWFTSLPGGLNCHRNGKFEIPAFEGALRAITKGHLIASITFRGAWLIFTVKDIANTCYRVKVYGEGAGRIESFSPADNKDGRLHRISRWGTELAYNSSMQIQVPVTCSGQGYIYNSKSITAINQGVTFDMPPATDFHTLLSVDGDLWACTSEGLVIFRNGDLNSTPERYFKGLVVTGGIRDREGICWVSTTQRGLFKAPSFSIRTYKPAQLAENDLLNSMVVIAGKLVVSTRNGFIYEIDSSLETKVIGKSYGLGVFRRFSSVSNSRYYITRVGIHVKNGKIMAETFPGVHYIGIMTLSNNTLLGFFGRGYKVHPEPGNYRKWITDSSFTHRVNCALEYPAGTVWLGSTEGLYYLQTGKPDKVYAFNDTSCGPLGRISDIQVHPGGDLLIATLGQGLFIRKGERLFHLAVKDGLPSDMINRLFVDPSGTIWLATNSGLAKIEASTGHQRQAGGDAAKGYKITCYSDMDGLSSNFTGDVLYWNRHIWVLLNKGLNYFPPGLQVNPQPTPVTKIQETLVNNQPMTLNDLAYYQNNLSIAFNAFLAAKPGQLPFYSYSLIKDGQHSDWLYTSNRNVPLLNLVPGSYEFRVRARNRYGTWGEPDILAFTIRPHFTQTAWFSALITLLVLVLVYLGYRYLQKKHRLDRQLQYEKLRANEAELKALRSQMNPHFIFNTLNSIQNFIFKEDFKNSSLYLGRFSLLIRDGLNYSRSHRITIQEEQQFLVNYLELEKMRHGKKFDFEVDLDTSVQPGTCIPSLMIQPLVENAVKHAFTGIREGGRITVSCMFDADDDSLLIVTVTDNGIGFGAGKPAEHRSLGLEILKERLQLLNSTYFTSASILCEPATPGSGPRPGTKVTMTLPCL